MLKTYCHEDENKTEMNGYEKGPGQSSLFNYKPEPGSWSCGTVLEEEKEEKGTENAVTLPWVGDNIGHFKQGCQHSCNLRMFINIC